MRSTVHPRWIALAIAGAFAFGAGCQSNSSTSSRDSHEGVSSEGSSNKSQGSQTGPTDPAHGSRYVNRLCTLVLKRRPEQQVTGTVVQYDAREVVVRTEDGRVFYATADDVLRIILHPGNTTSSSPETAARRDTFSYVVFGPKHLLSACAPGFDKSALKVPDTVAFVEKDSVLTLRVPAGAEPYHAHLYYKRGEELLEHVEDEALTPPTRNGFQEQSGLIRISLADYPEPQHLVVTSARTALTESVAHDARNSAERSRESDGETKSEDKSNNNPRIDDKSKEAQAARAILPNYIFSVKLVPAEKAETLISLQNFHQEVTTPLGSLQLLVASLNQGDMIVSVVDTTKTKKFSRLFPIMSAYYATEDALLVPRLSVEVSTAEQAIWQRVSVLPVPTNYPKEVPGAKLFALRAANRELATFAAPAQVALVVPQSRVSVKTDLFVKFSGLRSQERYKFILTRGFPSVKEGDYVAETQVHDVTPDNPTHVYTVDASNVDVKFPLTAFVAHRFATVWKERGGLLPPPEPQDKSGWNRVKPPARVIGARCAAHYALIPFFGPDPAGAWAGPSALIPGALMDPDLPSKVPFSSNILPPIIGLPPIIPGSPGYTEVINNFNQGPHWFVVPGNDPLPDPTGPLNTDKWRPPPPNEWPPKNPKPIPPLRLIDWFIYLVGPVEFFPPLKAGCTWPADPTRSPVQTPSSSNSTHGGGSAQGCCCCCCCGKDGHAAASTLAPYAIDVTTITGGSK